MNVKPGDIARVVGGAEGNAGKQVYVIEQSKRGSPWWWVEALEPVRNCFGELRRAGSTGDAHDQYLRRIDPPTDDADITETGDVPRELEVVR